MSEITQEQITVITEQVIAAIKEKYVLTEKNFNLDSIGAINSKIRQELIEKNNAFITNVCIQACKYYKIDIEDLNYRRLAKRLRVKMIIFKLCRELPEEPISYKILGDYFGKLHSTVLHSIRAFDKKYKNDIEFRLEFTDIKSMVNKSLEL